MSELGAWLTVGTLLVSGCSSTEEPAPLPCVEVSTSCQPIVNPPTFDALYTNVFSKTCATTGQCHGPAVAGGLDMRTADAAYAGLSKRVKPESLGCSLLLQRVESGDVNVRMPPGPNPLSEPQRCAIRQWIANGAQR